MWTVSSVEVEATNRPHGDQAICPIGPVWPRQMHLRRIPGAISLPTMKSPRSSPARTSSPKSASPFAFFFAIVVARFPCAAAYAFTGPPQWRTSYGGEILVSIGQLGLDRSFEALDAPE